MRDVDQHRIGAEPTGESEAQSSPDHSQDGGSSDGLPDHVVVFVHGMGKALKGGTLQEWAQPLMQSLYDLSVDTAGGLSDAAPLIIDSAHAVGESPEVRVKVLKGCTDGQPDYLDVVMTEASWASDFTPATPASTYWWAFATAGRVYSRSLELLWWSLYPGARTDSLAWWLRKALQAAVVGAAAVTGLFLIGASIVALALLVTLAQFPGGRFWLGRLVSLFADFLGDPEVWKRKPLQAAAMRQRVRDTLQRWGPDRDVPVTVVAHSQGAAICGQLLFQNRNLARVTNFVSVGSGLSLLGYAQWGGRSEDPVDDWLQNASGVRWINVWGKFDFVPAGPIGAKPCGDEKVFEKIYDRDSPGNGSRGPEEHPVYNRSGVIHDHIVYSQNRIEVIDPIAQLILPPASQSGALSFRPVTADPRRTPHRVMVKSLGVTRLLAVMTGVLAAPRALTSLGTEQWSRALLRCDPDANTPWWSSRLCSNTGFRWGELADWPVLITSSLLVAGLMVYLLNGLVWGLLHSKLERRRIPPRRIPKSPIATLDVERRFGRAPGNPWRWVFWYLASALLLAAAAPLSVFRPGPWWIAVYAAATGLWAVCFLGTEIEPLAARQEDVPPRPCDPEE